MQIDAEKLKYLVSADGTIEDAWTIIEDNRHRSVIIVDGEKVVGTLSDGDIRKAMLNRRMLRTPIREIMNVNFISLTAGEKAQSQDLFKRKDIFIIPIVDHEMNLIDIVDR